MKKQTIEIEVPDGKKAIWKDNKIIFGDIKHQLPKTWEEFCEQNEVKKTEYYLNVSSCIEETGTGKRNKISNKNLLPNRKAAEQHLAFMQLHQLRDCYRQGWKPNLEDSADKYSIQLAYNTILKNIELRVFWYPHVSTFLSFQTRELAEEFLTNFRELIKQAGDLI